MPKTVAPQDLPQQAFLLIRPRYEKDEVVSFTQRSIKEDPRHQVRSRSRCLHFVRSHSGVTCQYRVIGIDIHRNNRARLLYLRLAGDGAARTCTNDEHVDLAIKVLENFFAAVALASDYRYFHIDLGYAHWQPFLSFFATPLWLSSESHAAWSRANDLGSKSSITTAVFRGHLSVVTITLCHTALAGQPVRSGRLPMSVSPVLYALFFCPRTIMAILSFTDTD